MNRIGNRLYVAVGFISAVITVVPFALSNTVRLWVRDHSNWLYGALALAVVIVIIILGFARDLNRKCQELEASTKKPSRNDINMLREIMTQIPRDGTLMTWLKTDFVVKRIPAANVEAVDQLCQKLSMNPLEFNNAKTNCAYENFKIALEDFSIEITQSTSFVRGSSYKSLHVPLPDRESEEEGYYNTLGEIKESVGRLTSAYDNFLKTCSMNGLDIYNLDLPAP